ncbi:acyl-homoserine-lactone synthase [Lichenihabitans sp. Uapishka_5]|uniref:acyl-homoserine-lactone synthase n=1 Tax=Lichenihabitans sp. Uapishka_5 TaxID=3037302 RepID=UPI0029E7D9C7|nr:acyl-homoserine-lactone synthase [Lichenihabitans sp. Uapishka_5]MDX7950844.1 acyl-homoserine-lactone synthase [Lichenihabitans sp. Uapishka_5]
MLTLYAIRGFDPRFAAELDLAFRFRHDAFVEEAGWNSLRRADAREIDQFDTDDTIHIVAIDQGAVRVYSRLNPTTRPYVLSSIYPHLAAQPIPCEDLVWEWSRMGTAKHARTDGRGWSGPIGLLFRCVSHVAMDLGIASLVWQAHPSWVSRASQLGFDPRPLGFPHPVDNKTVIAAVMDVESHVFPTMDRYGVPSLPRTAETTPVRRAA